MSPLRFDTTFDFRSDAKGKDPDSYSATLRAYHRILWSKQLPYNKGYFHLDTSRKTRYLYHQSGFGTYLLASDSVIHTYDTWKRVANITCQCSDGDRETFLAATYTIGGMLVFPGNRIEGKNTINQERGTNRRICDRLDLTLECIRRHYVHQKSPLSEVLGRYADFFDLFGDFRGYVSYFFLEDMLRGDDDNVRFLIPFDDFESCPYPTRLDTYERYRSASMEFVGQRNTAISNWVLESTNT